MKRFQVLKRLFVGRPMSHGEMEHTLLPKVIALPVFSSDPLSSNAYATQEIMLVLGLAGAGALTNLVPISFAVAIVLATVVVSYRQTVRAYPSGGGAYIVAHENLGTYPGLIAAAALLVDYVLTVSVSVAAGVDAITSAAPGLTPVKIQLCIAFVAFITMMNLRGAKESGTLFAVPTYGFVLSIYIMLISGFVQCLGGCPVAESSDLVLHKEQGLALFLILRAFAAGTTALTGVEAISNGVPAFRYPQSRNAATTLGIMGTMSISMFIGITWLANQTQIRVNEESVQTVVAQIADTVFQGGFMFYVVQVMTAGILILAANTAYQDFPRLSSILARDRFMPHQFMNRGDRLVFSNGIFILSTFAVALIVIFDANLTRLIQLYLVGVFMSFTLSQSGMVVHWRRLKDAGWRRKILINGFGATVTGIVFCVVVITKFEHGAYIPVTATPVLVYMMRSIHKHYSAVVDELAHPSRKPVDRRRANQHMVLLVQQVDAAVARSLGVVRSMRPAEIVAVASDPASAATWKRLAPEIPLEILSGDGNVRKRLRAYLLDRRSKLDEADFLTLVVPELLRSRSLFEIFRRPGMTRLKAAMLRLRNVQLLNIPMVRDEIDPTVDETIEPARNDVLVLVSGVHNSTLQAIEYAESLHATDIRAVSFGLDPEGTENLGNLWLEARIPHPLEIEASPFRDIGLSLRDYIRGLGPDGVNRMVTVIMPEFVVKKRRHQLLHGQTALVVKRYVLFERGVAAVSVPFHLERS